MKRLRLNNRNFWGVFLVLDDEDIPCALEHYHSIDDASRILGQEPDLTPLAPSGISPWQHVVSLHDGRLTLMWQENGKERVRTFTNEETGHLLEYLYQHRDAIFNPWHDETTTSWGHDNSY